jgi:hypothetical protein
MVRVIPYCVPGPLLQLVVSTTTHQLSARLSKSPVLLVAPTGSGSAIGEAMVRARRGVKSIVWSFVARRGELDENYKC